MTSYAADGLEHAVQPSVLKSGEQILCQDPCVCVQ